MRIVSRSFGGFRRADVDNGGGRRSKSRFIVPVVAIRDVVFLARLKRGAQDHGTALKLGHAILSSGVLGRGTSLRTLCEQAIATKVVARRSFPPCTPRSPCSILTPGCSLCHFGVPRMGESGCSIVRTEISYLRGVNAVVASPRPTPEGRVFIFPMIRRIELSLCLHTLLRLLRVCKH